MRLNIAIQLLRLKLRKKLVNRLFLGQFEYYWNFTHAIDGKKNPVQFHKHFSLCRIKCGNGQRRQEKTHATYVFWSTNICFRENIWTDKVFSGPRKSTTGVCTWHVWESSQGESFLFVSLLYWIGPFTDTKAS